MYKSAIYTMENQNMTNIR